MKKHFALTVLWLMRLSVAVMFLCVGKCVMGSWFLCAVPAIFIAVFFLFMIGWSALYDWAKRNQ